MRAAPSSEQDAPTGAALPVPRNACNNLCSLPVIAGSSRHGVAKKAHIDTESGGRGAARPFACLTFQSPRLLLSRP